MHLMVSKMWLLIAITACEQHFFVFCVYRYRLCWPTERTQPNYSFLSLPAGTAAFLDLDIRGITEGNLSYRAVIEVDVGERCHSGFPRAEKELDNRGSILVLGMLRKVLVQVPRVVFELTSTSIRQ